MKTNYIQVKDDKSTAKDIGRLAGKLKELVEAKKIELKTIGKNPNDYGYTDWDYYYIFTQENYEEIINFLNNKKTTKKKTPTEEEIKLKWAKRLNKLTDIPLEDAIEIANEKLKYKYEQVQLLQERQMENTSIKREKLIHKKKRENPLRYIKDKEHATNILIASRRHKNSNYEELLEEGRFLVKIGEIENSKEFARTHFKYSENK